MARAPKIPTKNPRTFVMRSSITSCLGVAMTVC
jgi:hypothetical protein